MKFAVHIFAALVFVLNTLLVHAQIPRTLSYQGVLTDSVGRPKPDGPYSFAFRLYPSASGGTALWTEIKSLPVSRGLFSTVLGDQVPVNLSFDAQYWLGIQVAADPELSPRISLTSVGYSWHSLKADTAQYAMTAPQQTYVDSARIARSIPNNIVSTSKIVDGAVTQAKLAPDLSLPPGGTAGGDLAGTYPNPTIATGAVSTAKLADGAVTAAKISTAQVVKSLNGVRDAVTFRAQGGATITSSGDTITINAGTGGGGVGVQSIQNTNNTLDVINPTGPTVTVNVKSQGIGTTQLADNAVTSAKIPTGQVVKSLNTLRDDVTLVAGSNVTITPSANTLTIASAGWSLTGNAGTMAGTNFIGTTDNIPFTIRVNNQQAGRISSTGITFLGYQAGNSNTAISNVGIGYQALFSNTTGSANTASGWGALSSNTTGGNNTASGFQALRSNTTGGNNTASGWGALSSNTTGGNNTASGVSALFSNTTGASNTASGVGALYYNTTGGLNTASGERALFSNTTGIRNTASGVDALYSNIESYNTAYGSAALYLTTNSQFNTAIGYAAGNSFNNGYNNVFLGANTDVNGAGYFNVVAVGQATTVTASNQARIGNGATNSIGGFANWTNFSDGRYKKNVKEDVKGLDFIMKLHPVTYNLNVSGLSAKLNESRGAEMIEQMKTAMANKEKIIQSGFIAQEVEQSAKELGYDFSGVDAPKNDTDFYGLRYAEFTVPLVKAVQELYKENKELTARVAALEAMVKSLTEQR